MARKKRKRNPGWFTRNDPRRSDYVFTDADRKKGYQRALEVCTERGWECLAWFYRMMRKKLKEKDDGPQEKDRRRAPA